MLIGHGDGVGSMRWDGKTWIDEGRLPNTVYESRGLVEDAQGILWVSGGGGKLLRVDVAPTGMRDSKVQIISRNEGLIDAITDVEFVAGSIFVTFNRSKNIYRWDDGGQQICHRQSFPAPHRCSRCYVFSESDQ